MAFLFQVFKGGAENKAEISPQKRLELLNTSLGEKKKELENTNTRLGIKQNELAIEDKMVSNTLSKTGYGNDPTAVAAIIPTSMQILKEINLLWEKKESLTQDIESINKKIELVKHENNPSYKIKNAFLD